MIVVLSSGASHDEGLNVHNEEDQDIGGEGQSEPTGYDLTTHSTFRELRYVLGRGATQVLLDKDVFIGLLELLNQPEHPDETTHKIEE